MLWCRYQGHISAALVLGGVDCTGPHLFTVSKPSASAEYLFRQKNKWDVYKKWFPQKLEAGAGMTLGTASILCQEALCTDCIPLHCFAMHNLEIEALANSSSIQLWKAEITPPGLMTSRCHLEEYSISIANLAGSSSRLNWQPSFLYNGIRQPSSYGSLWGRF